MNKPRSGRSFPGFFTSDPLPLARRLPWLYAPKPSRPKSVRAGVNPALGNTGARPADQALQPLPPAATWLSMAASSSLELMPATSSGSGHSARPTLSPASAISSTRSVR